MYCSICGKSIEKEGICDECEKKRLQYLDNENNNDKEIRVLDIIEKRVKEPTGIQIIKYLSPIYLITILYDVIILFIDNKKAGDLHESFELFGNYLVATIIFGIFLIVISIILSQRNINNNYDDKYEADKQQTMVNLFLSVLIYYIIILLIKFLLYTNSGDEDVFFIGGYEPFLALLLIPIIKTINKGNYVSKKIIDTEIYKFFLLISIPVYFILNIYGLYLNIVYLVPCTIIGLNNNKTDYKKVSNEN